MHSLVAGLLQKHGRRIVPCIGAASRSACSPPTVRPAACRDQVEAGRFCDWYIFPGLRCRIKKLTLVCWTGAVVKLASGQINAVICCFMACPTIVGNLHANSEKLPRNHQRECFVDLPNPVPSLASKQSSKFRPAFFLLRCT